MRRQFHYRRFHFFHIDVFAVITVAVTCWFLWPEVSDRKLGRQRDMPSPFAAYGEMDVQTVGSVLYPGHFAFATPIGFAAVSDPELHADSQWRTWDVEPFFVPPENSFFAEQSLITADKQCFKFPKKVFFRESLREKQILAHEKKIDIYVSDNLFEIAFTCPIPDIDELRKYSPIGYISAVFTVNPDGTPSNVFILPEGTLASGAKRLIEQSIMRGSAPTGKLKESITGRIRIDWQS